MPNETARRPEPSGAVSFWDRCEPAIEWAIRICGWSAILFVLAIFAFVFKEAFPALGWLDLTEFITSEKWRPEAEANAQFGIFALIVGTGCVTLGSTLLSVPFGLGAAVYLSRVLFGQDSGGLEGRDRALGGDTFDCVGIHRGRRSRPAHH